MSNIEDLVPPLELCKQIPEGDFADSPLVWEVKDIGETALVMRAGTLPPHLRFGRFKTFLYPAPTLAEILEALANKGGTFARRDERGWMVMFENPGDDNGYGYQAFIEHDTNPATAALKLFLEMEARR